jgi:hypothetical protein
LQAAAGVLPIDPAKDPTALMMGWSDLSNQVEDIARQERASYVLTSGYALTSLLGVYSTGERPIIQFNERSRWLSFDQPQPSLFLGRGLYVSEIDKDQSIELENRFFKIELVGHVVRRRGEQVAKQYLVYRLVGPVSTILDPIDTGGANPQSLTKPHLPQ